jgi:tetraacyldisaccharide 4'-kinase
VRLRALAYRLGLARRRRIAAAVVSVGNLSVGGTGKTPTALWLAEALQKRGYRVAILSRGYGGSARTPLLVADPASAPDGVTASSDVAVIGDESVLLARRFSGPVIVGRRRADAGVLAAREFGADVVVLDDGFQHLALARDFDLVCLRGATAGDDAPLPAGRLREPPAALRRANALLLTDAAAGALSPAVAEACAGLPRYRGEIRAVALVTPDTDGWRELPMGVLGARRALGVAGLADPEAFYQTLHDWDARVEDFLEFPDHHVYTLDDWKRIAHRSRELDLVVTTEKDLVKLERFPFAKDKLVALRISMTVENGEELIHRVVDAVERRRAEPAKPRRWWS